MCWVFVHQVTRLDSGGGVTQGLSPALGLPGEAGTMVHRDDIH